MVKKVKAFIVKSFPCCMDGISKIETKIAGTLDEVPEHLMDRLEDGGFIALGDDIPEGLLDDESDVEDEDDGPEEGTLEYFQAMTKAQMIALLEGEELTGKEKHDDLVKICVEAFGDDDDDDEDEDPITKD